MTSRPDGDPRYPLLPEDDDWFSSPAEGPAERGEVAWQDEPESLPLGADAELGKRQVAIVLAVLLAVVLGGAGILLVRAIGGSDGKTATPASTAQAPTTPAATTPVTTSPGSTTPSSTTPQSTDSVPTDAVLRSGSTGAGVTALQKALTKIGYFPGTADGNFGPATVRTVAAFQKSNGLTADGIAGAETIAAINAALARG